MNRGDTRGEAASRKATKWRVIQAMLCMMLIAMLGVVASNALFVYRLSDDENWTVWSYWGRISLEIYTTETSASVPVTRWRGCPDYRDDPIQFGNVWLRADTLANEDGSDWLSQMPNAYFNGDPGCRFYVVDLPLWIPILLVVWVWFRARPKRIHSGSEVCTGCGYDLTGNVSGVCPECGSPCVAEAGATGCESRT